MFFNIWLKHMHALGWMYIFYNNICALCVQAIWRHSPIYKCTYNLVNLGRTFINFIHTQKRSIPEWKKSHYNSAANNKRIFVYKLSRARICRDILRFPLKTNYSRWFSSRSNVDDICSGAPSLFPIRKSWGTWRPTLTAQFRWNRVANEAAALSDEYVAVAGPFKTLRRCEFTNFLIRKNEGSTYPERHLPFSDFDFRHAKRNNQLDINMDAHMRISCVRTWLRCDGVCLGV